MHDCPCCGDVTTDKSLLCDNCIEADCLPNSAGDYNNCERSCETCGVPGLADFYFCVIIERADGETDYVDGYVCADHATEDPEAYVSSTVTVLEFELKEIVR